MNKNLKDQIDRMKTVLQQLELASTHSKTCISHLESQEIPRTCAHLVALEGHLEVVKSEISEFKRKHSQMAKS